MQLDWGRVAQEVRLATHHPDLVNRPCLVLREVAALQAPEGDWEATGAPQDLRHRDAQSGYQED